MRKSKLLIILLLIILPISILFVNIINRSDAKENRNDNNGYLSDEIIEDKSSDQTNETEASNNDVRDLTVYDSQNGIDMSVALGSLGDDTDTIEFQMLINNHQINLEEIQLDDLARVTTSEGKIIDDGFVWESYGTGHHISGTLSVPKSDLINESLDYIELEFTEVGNADRLSFRWDKELLDVYFKGGIE